MYEKIKNGKITDDEGNEFHYLNDNLHRDDGPAVIFRSGSCKYYKHGILHNEDGPAVIYEDPILIAAKGTDKEWWIEGKQMKEQEFLAWKACNHLNNELPSNSDNPDIAKKMKI